MSGEKPFSFSSMSAVWTVLQLFAFTCICLPPQAQGGFVVSRSDAPTESKEAVGLRPIKKRSTNSANVEMYSLRVASIVTSRFAQTVMSTKALNKAGSSQEIFFEVELPKTAFITNFSMEIDGQMYAGEVKEKEKAKKQYENAVSSGQTAGLVKASGRMMEKFSVSVNIAAQSSVTFTLMYEELLQRKHGKYEILTRVKADQPVREFQIQADIYEPEGVAYVEATATFLTNELLPLIEKTITDTTAHISFSPTVEQQRKCPGCDGTLINGDFTIEYDVKREENLGEVQVVNGYFVHFFSPPDLARVPKNVVFLIDRSGSMSGAKIEQTRDAMTVILKDLHHDDHFGIILFDGKVVHWNPSLTKATEENVAEAITYVKKIKDKGSTNINGAVLSAVQMLVEERKKQRIPERSTDMVILLTDGMPNTGVTNAEQIQQNVRSATRGSMSLFCLGVGNDVDYSFLDVMCKQNKGLARRIFLGSDVVIQLKGFYEEVSSPLLLEVELRYPDNTVGSVTKNHYSQLFNGSEIVVAGQLDDNNMDNFLVEVFGQGPLEDFQVQGKARVVDWHRLYPEKEYIFGDFTERLWAYLTIQQLLEKSDLSTQQEKDNITAKALDMSLQYSFVTPLTSMVVTKPDTEDGSDSPLIADKLTEEQRQKAERNVGLATAAVGFDGSSRTRLQARLHAMSRGVSDVDGDPHFMIELPDRKDALCFNINDKPGTIFNLVRDPTSDFVVNGQLVGKKKLIPDNNLQTYFGHFGITHLKLGLRLDVNTHNISVFNNGKRVNLLWSDATHFKDNNMDLKLTNNCRLTVMLRHSVKFIIIRHTKVWKRQHDQQDYLGFYTLDSHHLSALVQGLLGQFYHGVEFEVAGLRPGKVQEQLDATMYVKGQTLNVTRHWQKDFSSDVKNGKSIACWFVDNDGRGLIDGTASDYIVSTLFEY